MTTADKLHAIEQQAIARQIARASAFARSARHLTARETDRLLHRYDLPVAAGDAIAEDAWEQADYAWEVYGEQMAERGSARRPAPSAMAVYYTANPLHGPDTAPFADDRNDDDLPF